MPGTGECGARAGRVRADWRRSPRHRVRAGRRHEARRGPGTDVDEAVERGPLEDADVIQRATVELHVGEVLEEDVVGLVVRALELLPGQRGAVLPREGIYLVADDDPEVLEAHLVDALVDRRDELDERDRHPLEDLERRGEEDLRDRPAVPDVLEVGGRVTFEQGPQVGVLVPLRHADDRKSTRLNSSHQIISYAVFCLKKKMPLTRDLTNYHLTKHAELAV